MRRIFVLIIILIFSLSVNAKSIHYEKEYQDAWCKKHYGKTEIKLIDFTRIDCETDTEAIEFDFAPKWAECTGQALYYGLMTGKIPSCVLIMENFEKDKIYLNRLQKLSDRYGFKIYTITPADIE